MVTSKHLINKIIILLLFQNLKNKISLYHTIKLLTIWHMHATRRMCKRHYPSIKWHFRNFYFILFLINAYYLLGVSVLLCRPTLTNDVLRKLLKHKLLHHDSSNNCESLFLCFALHCITLNIYSLNFVQHNKEHPCVLFC